MKHELQNIISGKSRDRHGDAIQAIASYIRRSKGTSSKAKEIKQIKFEEQTKPIIIPIMSKKDLAGKQKSLENHFFRLLF